MGRLFLFLAAVMTIGGAGLYGLMATTFPQTAGEIELSGLTSDVSVGRDHHGVPTIRAETEADAFFALGFVHAQDRFFQMELNRRVGAGRLSEMIGAVGLGTDKFMRTLGLYQLAERQVEHASPEFKRVLEAYAAGVNAWLQSKNWPKTPEFLVLNHQPEPWRPADSLVWGKLMATRLSNNWRTEVLRLKLSKVLDQERIDELWPAYPPDAPISTPRVSGTGASAPRHASSQADQRAKPQTSARIDPNAVVPPLPNPWDARERGAPRGASNAWAISGARSETGAPVLANDPHLGFSAPILWYLTRIETPGLTLSGATVPGVPLLLIGHNGHVSWGFTTTGGDTEDVFLEAPEDGSPNRYRTPHGSAEFETRTEVIKVKDGSSVSLSVRKTRHGPVISDVSKWAAEASDTRLLALSAPYLGEDDRTPEALFKMNRARDWASFEDGLRLFHSPLQNIFFADRSGRIAFVSAGRIPMRSYGDGSTVSVGWDEDAGWTGFIPFEQLPRKVDPPGGVLLNANNKVVDPGYPHLIAKDWEPPFRARRLAEVLRRDGTFSVDQVAGIQFDTFSTVASDLMPMLSKTEPETPEARAALRSLEAWDHRMTAGSRAPLLFYHWLLSLKRSLFADEAGTLFGEWRDPGADVIYNTLARDHHWCDDVTTPNVTETCQTQLSRSLSAALSALEETDRQAGKLAVWGDLHQARFDHPVFSRVPLLSRLVKLAVPTDGGHYTLNRGALALAGAEPDFTHRHGAGLRVVFDLQDLGKSRFMISTGQSGNPVTPHYDDLVRPWAAGEHLLLTGAAEKELRLRPSQPVE